MKVAQFKFLILAVFAVQLAKSEEGWFTASDGNEYYLNDAYGYNWFDAYKQCADRNLALVTIDSEEKNNGILEIITARDPYKLYWIGGVATVINGERTFFWTATGKEVEYTNWKTGEPSNSDDHEDCLHTDFDYKWNDRDCSIRFLGYLCEANPAKQAYLDEVECIKQVN